MKFSQAIDESQNCSRREQNQTFYETISIAHIENIRLASLKISDMKTEILYGVHPVFEALKAGKRSFFSVFISKDKASKRLGKVLTLAESLKIPIKKVNPDQLSSTADTDLHQGIGAKVSRFAFVDYSEIFSRIKAEGTNPFLLLLDNVVDPHNLGAIVRTALCFDVDGIFIPKDRSAPPTPVVSKASAGALEHVHLVRVTNMANTIKDLKKKGLWIFGMDKDADRSIFSVDFTDSVAVIVGGEEKGIRPLVKKQCDALVSIPQMGKIDSLNASVAAAIAMYEGFRQRKYRTK